MPAPPAGATGATEVQSAGGQTKRVQANGGQTKGGQTTGGQTTQRGHRPSPRVPGAPAVHASLRSLGALLLVATGAEHLELSLVGGYGGIPTIGQLFLFQAAGAFALGMLVVLTRHPLAGLGGAVFALATLGGYLLSLRVGLFGFHEVVSAPGIASGAMDIAAFATLAWVATSTARVRFAKVVLPLQAAHAAVLPVALAACVALGAALALGAPRVGVAGGGDAVRAITIPGYGRVLATDHGDTVYLLQARSGAPLPCRGSCLSLWPPLLVARSARPLHAGPGVRGRLGTVARDGDVQLTFNGYPLYTYAGDTGPRETNGEKIASFGGTWYLVRASATRAPETAVTARH